MLMCSAAGQGNVLQLQQLSKHVNLLGVADYDTRTPLHIASSEGKFEAVEFLVDKGVDVSAKDRWGFTPLDDAMRHKHEKIRKFLEDNGARSLQNFQTISSSTTTEVTSPPTTENKL